MDGERSPVETFLYTTPGIRPFAAQSWIFDKPESNVVLVRFIKKRSHASHGTEMPLSLISIIVYPAEHLSRLGSTQRTEWLVTAARRYVSSSGRGL